MARNPLVFLVIPFVLSAARVPAQTSAPVADVTLGHSAAALYGPWKFTVGDSPINPKTRKPLWAEPGFDDSGWENVDLTPAGQVEDPTSWETGYVQGWSARGHLGYSGYAWYRIRVRVEGRNGQRLALEGPTDVDDVYQAFANGELLGSLGRFTGNQPTVYAARPVMFDLPQTNNESGAFLVLAFRLWMDSHTAPDAGGMRSAPVLGEAGIVTLVYRLKWFELIRSGLGDVFSAVVFEVLAVVAFSLILFDRSDQAYAWMGLLFLLYAVTAGLFAISNFSQLISFTRFYQVFLGVLSPLIHAAWVIVWWVWFGRASFRWLPHSVCGLTLLLMISNVLANEVLFGIASYPTDLHSQTAGMATRMVLFGLLAWVAIDGIRRRGLDGWLVLPVILIRGVAAFANELRSLHVPMIWSPFGVTVTSPMIASYLVAVLIALLLIRRLLQSVMQQRQMALDVKQAQEVQQMILPEARLVLPGLTVESEYRPAREVGGDFFQIVPHTTDGSLLIVAGDVTGKGLKAGMLVALLVGAVRSTAETNPEPAGILAALNRRLLGRSDAQATCLAMRIDADGGVTLANAGHMAPYLNGESLPMEGALPLGMIAGAESSMMQFHLKQGDRLMLISDGVAEATDSKGDLFGFERVTELLRKATTAAQVAEAAQQFGQEDDISVIAVTRMERVLSSIPKKQRDCIGS